MSKREKKYKKIITTIAEGKLHLSPTIINKNFTNFYKVSPIRKIEFENKFFKVKIVNYKIISFI
jgi:hypothetical protein